MNKVLFHAKISTSVIYLSMIIMSLTLVTCESDETTPSSLFEDDEEYLSIKDAEALANTETIELTTADIVLPNGLTIDEFNNELKSNLKSNTLITAGSFKTKNIIPKLMAEEAVKITNKSRFIFPEGNGTQPSQVGLVYGAGLKDPYNRKKQTAGECNRELELYGLDCSGLIYQLFKASNINIPVGTADKQRSTELLQNAIKSSYPDYDKIKAEDLGNIIVNNMEVGDIIYWKRANGTAKHIGMILKDKYGNRSVAQSNGYWNDCNNEICGLCDKNLHPEIYNVGPRFFSLNQNNVNSFGESYSIVRISADISGNWNITFKCQGSEIEWISMDLDFPTTETTEWEISKSAYYSGDGVTYDVKFTFSYTKETNELSCHMLTTANSYPDFYRNDYFTQKLERDDTGFFEATLGNNENAGCDINVRLKNSESFDITTIATQRNSYQ